MVDLIPSTRLSPVLVVGFHGPIGSGKDATATVFTSQYLELMSNISLIKPTITRTSFAQPLKQSAEVLFGGKNFYGTQEEKAQEHPFWKEHLGPRWGTYRKILQLFGTEVMRQHVHNDFWALKMQQQIEEACRIGTRNDLFLITDVRFPNEADLIHKHGGFVVKTNYLLNKHEPVLIRPPWWKFWKKAQPHPSEIPLPDNMIDYTLSTLSFGELEQKVNGLLQEMLVKKFSLEFDSHG